MTASQLMTSLARYVAFMLLSWRLMPKALDEVAVYLSSALVLGSICDLGVNVTCLRFSAARSGKARLEVERRFLLIRNVLSSVVLCAVWFGATQIATHILGRPDLKVALRMAVVTALCGSYSSFILTLLQARMRFVRLSAISSLSAILQLALIAVAYAGGHLSLKILFASDVLGKVIIVAAHTRLLAAIFKTRPIRGIIAAWREMIGFSQWITVSFVVGAVQNYVPVILLSRAGSGGELARYNIGLALSGGFSLFLAAVMSVTMPEALKATTPAQRASYVKGVLPAALVFAALSIPIAWFGAPLAAHIVGKQFLAGIQVFRFLTIAQIFLVVTNPIQFLLYGMNRVKLCTAGDALIAILFCVAGAMLRDVMSAPGVALALLLCQTATKVALMGFVLKLVFWTRETPSLTISDAVLSE